jgi:hypothetical protein
MFNTQISIEQQSKKNIIILADKTIIGARTLKSRIKNMFIKG